MANPRADTPLSEPFWHQTSTEHLFCQ
jgi:hypothetical protein